MIEMALKNTVFYINEKESENTARKEEKEKNIKGKP